VGVRVESLGVRVLGLGNSAPHNEESCRGRRLHARLSCIWDGGSHARLSCIWDGGSGKRLRAYGAAFENLWGWGNCLIQATGKHILRLPAGSVSTICGNFRHLFPISRGNNIKTRA
jgi:hypothetical protein